MNMEASEHEEFKKPLSIPKKRSRNGEPRNREEPPTPVPLVIQSSLPETEPFLEKGYRL
jgi:hypothetical protein